MKAPLKRATWVAVAVMAATLFTASTPAAASDACPAATDPMWAPMRAEADAMVQRGEMTVEKAEAYKCDPSIIFTDLNKSLQDGPKVEVIEPQGPPSEVEDDSAPDGGSTPDEMLAQAKAKKKCIDKIGLNYEVGVPVAMTARHTLNWCYNGKTVSDWSGECTGSITTWGKAIFWSFDSCSTDAYLPYKLGKRNPGGIHHHSLVKFTNKTPWTFDQDFWLDTWGHCKGTWDQAVEGKLLGNGKSNFKGCA